MLYFSKIGDVIINLEHITLIKYVPMNPTTGMIAHAIITFIDDGTKHIEENEYFQLVQDIDTACSLVKLQQERGEER